MMQVTAAHVMLFAGVSADKFPQVRQLGFAGAAVLGTVWQASDPISAWCELLQAADSA